MEGQGSIHWAYAGRRRNKILFKGITFIVHPIKWSLITERCRESERGEEEAEDKGEIRRRGRAVSGRGWNITHITHRARVTRSKAKRRTNRR